jgi:hypothetical protein
MAQTAEEWLARYAAELGLVPPTEQEVELVLALAGVAAHASERTAAPVTCWLAARSGTSPQEALAAGRRLAGDNDGG